MFVEKVYTLFSCPNYWSIATVKNTTSDLNRKRNVLRYLSGASYNQNQIVGFLWFEPFSDDRCWKPQVTHCFTLFIINDYETSKWNCMKHRPDPDNLVQTSITLMTWWQISWSTLHGVKWTYVSQDPVKSWSREIRVWTFPIALKFDRQIGQRCRN